ncbi:transglutaminase-like protein [Elsinoe australis]|uniref:Transglutaminase-like protein n=1 Tax=Elsinoe australis TaxID=40998 RepID=A0A4U7B622_9PEZI|nr:transglutaminase-like protein [Elsinoe australis]
MGGPPQQVPTRFPCWCRAVYSWGGETKRDLGFIEGDLIECLNAGDGSWWTGRLRRDQRAVGLFPSNFVQVLGEDFQPAPISRNISPMPSANGASPQKANSTFRKPFQAYEKLGYKGSENSSREATPEKEKPKSKWKPYSSMKTAQAPTGTLKKTGGSSPLKEENKFRIPSPPARTVARMKSRAHSPAPPQARARSPAPPGAYRPVSPNPSMRPVSPMIPRAVSPAPSQYRPHSPNPQTYRPHSPNPQMYRPHSPNPQMYRPRSPNPQMYRPHSPNPQAMRPHSPNPQMYRPQSAMDYEQYRAASPNQQQEYHDSRAPSPQPWKQDDYYSRAPSPGFDVGSSPPPPAPPPHRTMYQASRAPSPAPPQSQQQHRDGRHSPAPPHSPGMTPSPLRDAMNEVMSSLHDMSGVAREPSPAPKQPPGVWSPDAFEELRSQKQQPLRAQSALGLSHQYQSNDSDSNPSLPPSRDGPPVLSNYVQRMEQRLRHAKSSGMDFSSPEDDIQTVSDHPPLQQVMRMGTGARRTESRTSDRSESQRQRMALHRKSAYELGRNALNRTSTVKSSVTSSSSGWRSNATTQSNSTQATSQSIMSKSSAGAVSATSAGSLSRRKFGMGSLKGRRPLSVLSSRSQVDLHDDFEKSRPSRPASPISGPSYHSSHATQSGAPTPVADWNVNPMESAGILGGLSAPRAKKSGFFKKMLATAKTTAKTGAANARSTIGSSNGSRPSSRAGPMVRKSLIPDGVTAISHESENPLTSSAHRDMGLGGGSEWMQVRRDVNRSNSLSRNEKLERAERCQMLDILVIKPIEELLDQVEGDESLDGLPVSEPTDFQQPSLQLVDKSTRFINSIPPSVTPQALAQTYLCRPFRSDVQRLRAIFTWVSERITWEEDFVGPIETRRVVQTKRGCSEEIANLVRDLCVAVGLHAEVVRGYLKGPSEAFDQDALSRPNHWWNAVLCDGEWRIMDCSLAGPTNPRRSEYSSANSNVAEGWWFLARPMEICYTHIPCNFEQQHLCPPVAPEILLSLPCACPPYFRHGVEMVDFESSMLHVEGLEMTHLKLAVPEDVECVAEVEARAFARDYDGDLFESGDVVRKPAFAQPQWVGGRKIFTIKAVLPGDEGTGVLRIYAGKRGLMHSITSNPHALALSLPISHSGTNPPFAFHTRHPTPHAQRHDLYVVQPQCHRLVINNTFVFCIRQHPSSLSRFTPDTWGSSTTPGSASASSRSQSSMGMRPVSPNPYVRPTSAMSMISVNTVSASVAGSNYSNGSNGSSEGGMSDKQLKPAKLAVQSPSGKIIRLTRKQEYLSREEQMGGASGGAGQELASSWETVIKVGERGTWRGLVLADRSARWCVFAEWECI